MLSRYVSWMRLQGKSVSAITTSGGYDERRWIGNGVSCAMSGAGAWRRCGWKRNATVCDVSSDEPVCECDVHDVYRCAVSSNVRSAMRATACNDVCGMSIDVGCAVRRLVLRCAESPHGCDGYACGDGVRWMLRRARCRVQCEVGQWSATSARMDCECQALAATVSTVLRLADCDVRRCRLVGSGSVFPYERRDVQGRGCCDVLRRLRTLC